MNNTYTFRSLLEEYQQISIPKIQRDYAQGRNSGKAIDVRENFLNDIFSRKVKSLDFIFGTAYEPSNGKKKVFVPLDGQQRLTTLFLLYLYGNKIHELKIDNLCKFTYETRKAARDFCQAIVENEWPYKSNEDKLSESIVNQKWFMNYWLNDPTVEGMLTMLDAINNKAKLYDDYPDLDNITFRFFDMNENKLSDNLYIKMNSRGKPLTAFENFKASVDKILPKTNALESFDWLNDAEELKKKTTFDEKWKYCIDRLWMDMFWKYKENYLSDSPFIRFVVNMLSAYWVNIKNITINDEGEKDKFLRYLFSITGNEDYISFDKFKEVLPTIELDNEKKDCTLYFLADCLNSFSELLELNDLSEISCPSWEDCKCNHIKNILQLNDAQQYRSSNKERAMFYALIKCPYICLIKTSPEVAKNKIKHWMRVLWNIVEQEQERIRNFIGSVHLINELSTNIKGNNYIDIYEWLDGNNIIKSNFMKDQVREEIAKAKLIQNKTFEEDDIIYAEKHPLLKGCISALFENDNCVKVSFNQKIQERISLLNDLWKPYEEQNYNLVKVLVSLYNKETLDNKIPLKRNMENWKALVTDKFKECFRNNADNSIKECNEWKKMIAHTDLIDNSRESGKIIGPYSEKIVLWATSGCTWNAYGNVCLDNIHNNPILAYLVNNNTIECDQKIDNCDFFSGWQINFRYNKVDFQWNINGNVYLLENEERKTVSNNENYYISASDIIGSAELVSKLDKLIAQAYPSES